MAWYGCVLAHPARADRVACRAVAARQRQRQQSGPRYGRLGSGHPRPPAGQRAAGSAVLAGPAGRSPGRPGRQEVSTARRPLLVGTLTAAIVALVASAAVAVGAIGGPSSGPLGVRGGAGPGGHGFLSGSPQAAPKLPGTVVNVSLTNMGGSMMGGQGNGMMGGGAMGLSADHATVPHGTVSFLVTNDGSIDHEMVVLPLAGSGTAGARSVGGDGKIDEAGSLDEASKTGGAGAGDGIAPGASGWVTVTLAPGHYELVCSLPRHYTAGMYTQLNVT